MLFGHVYVYIHRYSVIFQTKKKVRDYSRLKNSLPERHIVKNTPQHLPLIMLQFGTWKFVNIWHNRRTLPFVFVRNGKQK